VSDLVLADKASIAHSRPIELLDIVLPTVTYHIACGPRDVQWGTTLYVASPGSRTALDASQVAGRREMTVTIPVDHPIVSRWLKMGVPPKKVTVTVWQKEERSALIERLWTGVVSSLGVDGVLAKLSVPARTTDSLARMLPTITSGPTCVHILYDAMCKINRADFLVSTTAILVDGRDVRVDIGDLSRIGNQWTQGGDIVHVASGERMTIAFQTDLDPTRTLTTLSMENPIPELRSGDAIEVYAGCAHDIITCNQKFGNQPRFFGDPYKPTKNPTLPTGLGTVEQA
jgi:uncharacterized phage protein (TIGR02218 family)